jgi:hypothetical protein
MFQYQKIILFLICFCKIQSNIINAQQSIKPLDANFEKNQNQFVETELTEIDTQKFYQIKKIAIQSLKSDVKVELKNIKTKNITSTTSIKFPANYEISIKKGMEKKQAVAFVFIPNYIKNQQGGYEEIIDVEVVLNESNILNQKVTGSRVYAANSVLSTGNWYKIAVSEQGLHKIDYNFIKNNCGVEPTSLNTNQIRLFGNGGEMLSEDNAVARHDDLFENAIKIVDGGDGIFNQGDYILFYANGPHTIYYDSAGKRIRHLKNLFNDESYYFLNFNQANGKRIVPEQSLVNFDKEENTGNYFTFMEQDSVNLGRFGKTWWGVQFSDLPGYALNRTYNFSIPNFVANEPVLINTKAGAISSSGTNNISFSANGQALHSMSLAGFGAEFFDPVIRVEEKQTALNLSSGNVALNVNFTRATSAASAYIDYVQLNATQNLNFFSGLKFSDIKNAFSGQKIKYVISNANPNIEVWKINNGLEPQKVLGSFSGNEFSFILLSDSLNTFFVHDGSNAKSPNFTQKVSNQNLHNSTHVNHLIICHQDFEGEANRLAAHHLAKNNSKTVVVTINKIYNEFSSGSQDISALRDFIKMYYDKASALQIPNSVLFFGDASYDYKNRLKNNSNYVPTYETDESVEKITGYCTDDFFGFLDDNENIKATSLSFINTLDIGVGRIPSNNSSEAKIVVDKIINYDSPQAFGAWKNNMTFVCDNGDGSGHLDDAEIMANYTKDSLQDFNAYKIYVGAYNLESTPAGQRAPDASRALQEQLFNGTFLVNFNGHGGPSGWCSERLLYTNDILGFKNKNKLPLFITATCDFAQFDNPDLKSGGEQMLLNENGGGIALMTTTQLVFQYQNRVINKNYFKVGFSKNPQGQFPTLGESYLMSKNLTYANGIDDYNASNFRKFALLGDPALALAFPKNNIKIDSFNQHLIVSFSDTFKALGKYTISGHIEDEQNQFKSDFNGVCVVTIFDKEKKVSTIPAVGSPARIFGLQNNIIFKGNVSVKNGKFSCTFIVPKDINYDYGLSKISLYAYSELEDAAGYNKEILIGGLSNNNIADNAGPVIKPFLNNEKFVNGGTAISNSTLLVNLSDDNGINVTGTSIGHDITAVLDNNSQNTYVLNNFYESELDDYKSGKVKFPLNNISVGQHSLKIKAWDILNNSNEVQLDFVVVDQNEGKLNHVYNYPNPFTTKTQFMFEHNMPNELLYVNIDVFNISGKIVKQIRETIQTPGTRYDQIFWDGKDQYGDKLGKGVYLYKLGIKSQSGFSDSKIQKLIILQ